MLVSCALASVDAVALSEVFVVLIRALVAGPLGELVVLPADTVLPALVVLYDCDVADDPLLVSVMAVVMLLIVGIKVWFLLVSGKVIAYEVSDEFIVVGAVDTGTAAVSLPVEIVRRLVVDVTTVAVSSIVIGDLLDDFGVAGLVCSVSEFIALDNGNVTICSS